MDRETKLSLETIISDHGIIQRDKPFSLRGYGCPGSEVKASMNWPGDQLIRKKKVKCDENGYWKMKLPAMKAGGPYSLFLESDQEQLVIEDLYFGDLWILAGQSNMQLPMERVKYRYPEEYEKGTDSIIRQFCMPIQYDFQKERDFISEGEWITGNKERIPEFSAVGYFFAEKLYQRYKIPIGLILTAVGGTPIKAWMSRRALKDFPEELKELEKCKDSRYVAEILEREEKRERDWLKSLEEKDREKDMLEENPAFWKSINLEDSWTQYEDLAVPGSVWLKTSIKIPRKHWGEKYRLSLGTLKDADITFVNKKRVGETTYQYPPREYQVENAQEDTEIAVRVAAIHGTGGFTRGKSRKLVWENGDRWELPRIWKYSRGCTMESLPEKTFMERKPAGMYQGMMAPLHGISVKGICWYQGEMDADEEASYPMYFKSMITDWREQWKEELPVLFVQLPNYDLEDAKNWVWFRNMQQKLLKIRNTAMVVTIDSGEDNDLHPVNKKPVGERLALAAFKLAYGEQECLVSPILEKIEKNGEGLLLSFMHAGDHLKTCDRATPGGFQLCFTDGTVQEAQKTAEVEIQGRQISIYGMEKEVYEVRYAWSNTPHEANICNETGLPLSPFRYTLR